MAIKTQGTEIFWVSSSSAVTKISKVDSVSGMGGSADDIEITDFDSTEKEYMQGLPGPGDIQCGLNYDPSDTSHQALYAAYRDGSKKTFIVGLSDGSADPTVSADVVTYPSTRTYASFTGYVKDMPLDLSANSKATCNLSIKRSGPITWHYKS